MFLQRLLFYSLLGLLFILQTSFAQSEEVKEAEIYAFANEVLGKLGRGSSKLYIEERVRGNKTSEQSPERIFTDKIRKLDVKVLDSLLTAEDWQFMKNQAERLVVKRWSTDKLQIQQAEVLPLSSSRKEAKYQSGALHLGVSPPFFSTDKQKAILFVCREDTTDGWESIMLYHKVDGKWKLVSSKLSMWHLRE